MSHAKKYKEGKITLKEYRKAQGFKLASKFAKSAKARKKAQKEYREEEAKLG